MNIMTGINLYLKWHAFVWYTNNNGTIVIVMVAHRWVYADTIHIVFGVPSEREKTSSALISS